MLTDINDKPNIQNWASLVRNTLSNLGFFNVWIAQGVGDVNIFLSVIKQRLSDTFVQNFAFGKAGDWDQGIHAYYSVLSGFYVLYYK